MFVARSWTWSNCDSLDEMFGPPSWNLLLWFAEISSQARSLKREAQSEIFPVSQEHQLIRNCLQSLKPPLVIGCRYCLIPALQVQAVRFANVGYFFPQLFDTLSYGSRHSDRLAKQLYVSRRIVIS